MMLRELISNMQWLLDECLKHNASYHHVSDKSRLEMLQSEVNVIRRLLEAEHEAVSGKE